MVPRLTTARLREAFRAFPVVALLDPRQAGKSTLATMLADEEREHTLYLDLELPSDRAKPADPGLYLARHEDKLIILDKLKVQGRWVVYPGRERYPLDARIEVIPFIEVARPDFRWAAASG